MLYMHVTMLIARKLGIPFIICVDNAKQLWWLPESIHGLLGVATANNPLQATTRKATCIDYAFLQHVEVTSTNYVSYSSYHMPLLAILSNSTKHTHD